MFPLRRSTWNSGKKSLDSDVCWARTESTGLVRMRTNDYGQVVDVGLLSLIEVHYCVLISSSSRWKNVIALSGGSALEKAFPCYGCVAWWFCNVLRYVVWQVWKDWMVVKSHILFVEYNWLWKVVKKSFLCIFVYQFPKTEVVCHQFREIHVSRKDVERGLCKLLLNVQ